MDIKIITDTRQAQVELKGLGDKIKNLRQPFINFHAYMLRRMALMFSRLRRGGTFRGITWKWFAPLYRRADGTIVPAYGGTPKIRGGGLVQGRMRHSGKRVKPSSSILQDTGRLKTAALTYQNIRGGLQLTMDTPIAYAEMQNELRPFQFFEDPADVNVLRRMIIGYIGEN